MCQLLNSTKLEKFPKTDNTHREQLNAKRPLLPLENQTKFINIADKSVGRRVAGRALQRDIGIVVYTHIAFFRIRTHHDIGSVMTHKNYVKHLYLVAYEDFREQGFEMRSRRNGGNRGVSAGRDYEAGGKDK